MNCPKCNAELDPRATVCPNCLIPVQANPQETQQPGTVPPQGYPQQTGVPPQGYAPQSPYGMPPQQPGYAVPPQQPGTVPPQGYAPQPPYGMPPQQPGYAVPPQQPGTVPPQGYAPQFGYGVQTNVSSASGTISEQKDLKTFQLFSSFLGWLGVGSFYAGYTQNGIRRIAFTIIAFLLLLNRENAGAVLFLGICLFVSNIVWSLVEAFTTKNDAKGVPMK